MWKILDRDNIPLTETAFISRERAETHLGKMSPVLSANYRIVHESGNPKLDRMLTEGLLKNDLERILLPLLSVDVYVPADPNTDNVVLAFFIKGVPEAVIPFKSFLEKCNGVLTVDYGDSDTIPNTSIVYIEMNRENLDIKDVKTIMEQVAMLANLSPSDFTVTFPHRNDKFPYAPDILLKYFTTRNEQMNLLAQRKAEKQAQAEMEKQIGKIRKGREETKHQDQDQHAEE